MAGYVINTAEIDDEGYIIGMNGWPVGTALTLAHTLRKEFPTLNVSVLTDYLYARGIGYTGDDEEEERRIAGAVKEFFDKLGESLRPKVSKYPQELEWRNEEGRLLYVSEDADGDLQGDEWVYASSYSARDAYTGEAVELDECDRDAVRDLFDADRSAEWGV